jgi:hypothetical protein
MAWKQSFRILAPCRVLRFGMSLLLIALAGTAGANEPSAEQVEFFETKIRPVLAQHCYHCHSSDQDKPKGNLRVNSRDGLLAGGLSGEAIVPGQPDESLLIEALKHESFEMPPDEKLPAAVIADFETWIRQGAYWPTVELPDAGAYRGHWAFQPVQEPLPPEDSSGWSQTPVDRFVIERLRREGLKPVEDSDRRTLIRRAYFDLIGLPPTPEQVQAFVTDSSEGAFARVVEELLASPHYGERWGRHWLDVARYSDTAGDSADYPIPQARLYRDYVIDSFNADKPYDQFIQEQLAGDILAEQDPDDRYAEQVIATGYIALSRRFTVGRLRDMHLTIEDTLDTIGRSMLGLTMKCARCHDHKFDPLTAADYYGLFGFFESTQYPFAGSENEKRPDTFALLIPPEEQRKRQQAHEQQVAELQEQIKQAKKDENKKQVKLLEETLQTLKDHHKQTRDVPSAYAVHDSKPQDAYVHVAGNPREKGETIPRRTPKFLQPASPDIPKNTSGRLQLAEWIAHPENPLTARVMVNRIWQQHFGRGLVETPDNFGFRGDRPEHPELLDWLAAEFVENGWSIKHIHRVILLSRVYGLSSRHDATNAETDPANRLWWRFNRRRLEAEAIRDTLLSVSGNLDVKRPGEHPFPPIDKWAFSQHRPFKAVYSSNHRSVYLMTQRIQRHPFLALFDGPDTNAATTKRSNSTVPLQALFFMNSDFVQEQAAGIAERIRAAADNRRARIEFAHQLTWGRPPTEEEAAVAASYIDEFTAAAAEEGVSEKKREQIAWTSYARILVNANEFLYVD